jgi:hypothetical protein
VRELVLKEARILANFKHFRSVEFAAGKCPQLAIRDRSIRKGEQGSNITVALARSRDATKVFHERPKGGAEELRSSAACHPDIEHDALGDDVKLDRGIVGNAIAPAGQVSSVQTPEVQGNVAIDGEPIGRVDRGLYRHAHTTGVFMNRKVSDKVALPASTE